MSRERITIVVDHEVRQRAYSMAYTPEFLAQLTGITVESSEVLPDIVAVTEVTE